MEASRLRSTTRVGHDDEDDDCCCCRSPQKFETALRDGRPCSLSQYILVLTIWHLQCWSGNEQGPQRCIQNMNEAWLCHLILPLRPITIPARAGDGEKKKKSCTTLMGFQPITWWLWSANHYTIVAKVSFQQKAQVLIQGSSCIHFSDQTWSM